MPPAIKATTATAIIHRRVVILGGRIERLPERSSG
jgi:hypothetical protein